MLHDNNNDSNPKRVLMVLRRGLSRESNELITIVIMVIKCRRQGTHVKTYIIRGSRHVQTRRFSSLHKGLADGMIKKDTGRAAADPTPVGRIHTHVRRTRRGGGVHRQSRDGSRI